ncbi:MAG: OmpA family protein [Candidatus Nanoarchaeia archaeon]|nr:OmpA family protein [Candidatus Nanoarchaeia archaeon]
MGNLTTGFKFFIILVIVGGIAAVIYFTKPELFKGKSGKSSTTEKSGGLFGSKKSDADLTLGVNTWSGFAPIVWMNGGLEPNENSKLSKEYGIKLRIKIADVFDDSRNSFKSDNFNLVYCTTDVLPIEMGASSGMTETGAEQFLQVDWSRGGDAIVVSKGIKTVADLKGKTISVAEGTASHSLLIKVLESNGLSMTDVQMKKVADGIESAKLYKAGAVDAAVVWSPDDLDCVAAISGSKVLVNTKVATHIIADGILVKKKFLEDNKEILIKFATAWLYANGEINKNESAKKEAAQAFATAFNVNLDFALTGLNNVRLTTLGDNKNFFGLNPNYQGITGEQLYSRMSIVYGDLSLAKSPIAWRNISNTSIIEGVTLTTNQEAEGAVTFSAVTEEVKKKEPISNKKVTINFTSGSFMLSDEAKSTIDKEFVNIAKSFSSARIRIEGNTDAVGNAKFNKALSLKRAQSVANYLVKEYKFDSNRFIVIGNGLSKAVADGVSGENEFYRRTDFELVEE